MDIEQMEKKDECQTLCFDFGTFHGFNFRSQSAVERELTAEELVNWNHDRDGEAEFWPTGDHEMVSLIFKGQSRVSASDLLELDGLFQNLDGGDDDENYLSIYHVVSCCGYSVWKLDAEIVRDNLPWIFFGSNFSDLRKEAAYKLLEVYYSEEYQVLKKSTCDGLTFDIDRFLDSPSFYVDEVKLSSGVALLVSPQ